MKEENMNEFDFKSSPCTSIEQSIKLLALGLKPETADMCITDNVECAFPCPEDDRFIHAWSLGRLWELYWSNKVVSDCLFGCGKYMNPYAKMIAMIEYDIEDGTFNKDYLDK